MKNLHKKAFSLVEISIVIIVVGILIVGVSQGIDLYQDMRLTTARALTKNSRVNRIPGLVSWYETAGENVFSSGTTTFKNFEKAQEGQKINRWRDSNPNSVYKYDATQTTGANQPKIIFDKDSALPIVRFDGNPKYLSLPDGTVPYGDSAYTVIFVSKADYFGNFGVLGSGSYDGKHKANAFRYQNDGVGNYWWPSPDLSAYIDEANKLQIFIFDYNKEYRYIYIDGVFAANAIIFSSPKERNSTTFNNTIGLTCVGCAVPEYLVGSIAELIIYDRALLATKEKISKNIYRKNGQLKLTMKKLN
jgi:prepilin-type N-terminal cleavage/methylation domain-containing protein